MRVFVTGVGGYIGGAVAVRLLQEGHTVVGLTRDGAKVGALARLGIQPVVGTLDDADVLTVQARGADAVVNAADSDHLRAVRTLVAALAGSGKPLIHTSGSSIVGVGTDGEVSSAIFHEDVLDSDSGWEPEHPIRKARVAIDRLVLAAAEQGVRTAVLCHSLIYGPAQGLPGESVLIAALVRQARAAGVVRQVGGGGNIWSNVHLGDVAELYLLALEKSSPGTFYFVESGEESIGAMAAAIARCLGLPGPVPWHPDADADAADSVWDPQFAMHALGSNSRVRGSRARDLLGWRPRHHSIIDWLSSTSFGETVER
ncbi:NAD-dependent epimerase/dehydratase family protein [Nonomuraea sp. NPDC050404]|uniref:NAD-dependent epimerase/dehydratase family protein n=1 Tax=Nonomuraea sp. NPDC050404 TaxID=3155783 RepID=UPI0033D7A94C